MDIALARARRGAARAGRAARRAALPRPGEPVPRRRRRRCSRDADARRGARHASPVAAARVVGGALAATVDARRGRGDRPRRLLPARRRRRAPAPAPAARAPRVRACRSPPTPRSRGTSPSSSRASARPPEQAERAARAARRDPLQRRGARARRPCASASRDVDRRAGTRRTAAGGPRCSTASRCSSRSRAAPRTTGSSAAAIGVRIGSGAARTLLPRARRRRRARALPRAARHGGGRGRRRSATRVRAAHEPSGRVPALHRDRPQRRARRASWSRRARRAHGAAADPHRAALRAEARGARAARPARGAAHGDRHARALVPLAHDRAPLAARVPAARHGRRRGAGGRAPRRWSSSPRASREATRAAARRLRGRRRPGHARRAGSRRRSTPAATRGRSPAIRALWDALWPLEPTRARSPGARGALAEPRRLPPPSRLRRRRRRAARRAGSGACSAPTCAIRARSQCRAEWWNLWKRVAGGLNARQQQHLLQQRRRPALLRTGKAKGPRPGPQELREMWQAIGELRAAVGAAPRAELATRSSARRERGRATEQELWALARLGGARADLRAAQLRRGARRRGRSGSSGCWRAEWPRAGGLRVRARADRARDRRPRARPRCRRSASASRARLETDAGRRARGAPRARAVPLEAREEARLLDESLPAGLRLRDDVSVDARGNGRGMRPT